MTTHEAKTAATLLADRTDRTETIGTENGVALTAYWTDGGQKMFYSLDAVRDYLAEREQAGC